MHTVRSFLCCFILVAGLHSGTQAQFSTLIGIDTTQHLGNFDHLFGMVAMPNGNIWVSGRSERTLTSSGGQVSNYGTLIQLSPLGNIITSRKSGFRSVNALAKTFDGNFILGGEGSGFFCTSGLCKSDMLVAKVTESYSVVWGRSFGNPNYNGSDGLKRVFETADSNVVVVGNIYQSSNNSHPFIAKVNGVNGDTLWTRAMAFPANQFGNDASEGPNGELFLGVSGDLRVFKLSASGTVDWSMGFANYGQVMRVFAQADGSVIAAGQYLSAGGTYNACLFKISGSAALQWFHDYNSPLPSHDEMLNDAVFVNGHFYLGGYQYSSSSFTGMYPMLIKTDSLGIVQWARTSATPDGEVTSLLAHGTSIIVGLDYEPPLLNNRPDILLIETDQANGANGCFVNHPLTTGSPSINTSTLGTSYYTDYETQNTPIAFSHQSYWDTPACLSTGIETASETTLFSVSQQNGILTIQPATSASYQIEIFDAMGRSVYIRQKESGRVTIDFSQFARQIVWIKVNNKTGAFSRGVVLE
jgi:hypothetical protein